MWFLKEEAPDNSTLWLIALESESLTSTETHYSNTEREVIVKLHVQENFHHCCSTYEVSMNTDHKPVVVIFKKNVATLLHRLQRIKLHIHQYNIRILYKMGPQLFIVHWLFRHNHSENIRRRSTKNKPEYKCHGNIHRHPRMHNGRGI